MRDYLYLSTVPTGEDCCQVGRHTYQQMRAEALHYMHALEANFPPPDGAYLTVQRERHDFGDYPSLVVCFDTDNAAAVEYAYMLESNEPETWAELGVEPYIQHGKGMAQ